MDTGTNTLCTEVCRTHIDLHADAPIGSTGGDLVSPALPIGVCIEPKTGTYRQPCARILLDAHVRLRL